jgi:hypothetical protein
MKNARPHNQAESSALDSANSTVPTRFTGTDNPRHLRAIFALLQRPRSREELDSIAGCANGPELIAELRRRGLTGDRHLPCERIRFIDRDGKLCRPGVYSFTAQGRRLIYAWLARRGPGKNG